MNPNPSGLDPTARSFTGQYSQLQNQGNVYQMGSTLTGLQHLQGGLPSQLGTRTGFGGMPASSSQVGGDRFQTGFNQLGQYQQAQSRHPGLALGNYAANQSVRTQFGGSQLGLQNQGLGNRQLMGANMGGVQGFGGVSQNPQGLQGMQMWSTGQQSVTAPSNLQQSLSTLNRMQGLTPQQQQPQLAQARAGNTLGQNISRDTNSVTLSGLLQQQQQQQQQPQQNPNPSQDLLSMMRINNRAQQQQQQQQQNPYGSLMSHVPQLQVSSGGGFSTGRSALPLERPGEQAMGAGTGMNGLGFDSTEFPSLSGVGSASALSQQHKKRLMIIDPASGELEENIVSKEEYPALTTGVENPSLKASVHGPIGRSLQSVDTSAPLPSETAATSSPPVSASQTYFHGSHNMPASLQDSLKNIQAGRISKSPPPGGRAPSTPQKSAGLMLLQPPQQLPASDDCFSLLGLNSVIRTSNEDLAMLALGLDLTQLGLKLDDPDNKLHKTFVSPWTDHQAPGDLPDFEIPACYKNVAEKLRPEHLAKFRDETLFYVFYSSPGEEAQALASATLINRGLAWHKDRKQWFMRVPNMNPQKSPEGERGSYIFFDTNQWKYVQKDNFLVKFDAVESTLPRSPLPLAMK